MTLYINPAKNQSGAYPNPKLQTFDGCIQLNDEQSAIFLQYNGFVTITQDPDPEIEGSSVTITPDLEAWEAWKAAHPDKPDPEPSVEYVTYSELAAAIREGVNLV